MAPVVHLVRVARESKTHRFRLFKYTVLPHNRKKKICPTVLFVSEYLPECPWNYPHNCLYPTRRLWNSPPTTIIIPSLHFQVNLLLHEVAESKSWHCNFKWNAYFGLHSQKMHKSTNYTNVVKKGTLSCMPCALVTINWHIWESANSLPLGLPHTALWHVVSPPGTFLIPQTGDNSPRYRVETYTPPPHTTPQIVN